MPLILMYAFFWSATQRKDIVPSGKKMPSVVSRPVSALGKKSATRVPLTSVKLPLHAESIIMKCEDRSVREV